MTDISEIELAKVISEVVGIIRDQEYSSFRTKTQIADAEEVQERIQGYLDVLDEQSYEDVFLLLDSLHSTIGHQIAVFKIRGKRNPKPSQEVIDLCEKAEDYIERLRDEETTVLS